MRISDWSSDVCSSDLRHRVLADLAFELVDLLVVADDPLGGLVVTPFEHVQRRLQLRGGHRTHPQDLVDDAIALFVAALDDVALGLGGHGSEPGLGIGDWGFGKARASGDLVVFGFWAGGHGALANPQYRIPNPAGRFIQTCR